MVLIKWVFFWYRSSVVEVCGKGSKSTTTATQPQVLLASSHDEVGKNHVERKRELSLAFAATACSECGDQSHRVCMEVKSTWFWAIESTRQASWGIWNDENVGGEVIMNHRVKKQSLGRIHWSWVEVGQSRLRFKPVFQVQISFDFLFLFIYTRDIP